MPNNGWPALPGDEWFDTLETVHLWTQVVGKIRMVRSPWINHSWGVTLYVARLGCGRRSSPMTTKASSGPSTSSDTTSTSRRAAANTPVSTSLQ